MKEKKPTFKWHVICVTPEFDDSRVQREIEKVGRINDLPIRKVMIPHHKEPGFSREGEPIMKKEKSFPGYLLVCLKWSDDMFHHLTNVKGVSHLLWNSQKPTPLESPEMALVLLRSKQAAKIPEKGKTLPKAKVGDAVKITSGPWKGHCGEIVESSSKGGTIIVPAFGQSVRVTIPFTDMEIQS